MEYIITNENIKMPKMIYGTAWKKEQTADLVEQALLSGFRGIDTAGQPKHYQEELVGRGLLKAYENGLTREELYLQTKFTPIDGQDPTNMPYDKSDPLEIQIEKSFENSKKNLHNDYIDSYLLHSPIFPGSQLKLAWETMESFHDKKEIGQLGISNCYDLDVLEYLYKNSSVKPAVVQNRFYKQSGYDKELRVWCKEKGIIYQSFWSLTANIHILNSDMMKTLVKKYVKSEAQIFYKFLNHIDIVPLNGTTSKKHMKEDLETFSFELEKQDIETLLSFLE
jgi:diketogulonate reductase-like aldo/keto reductase